MGRFMHEVDLNGLRVRVFSERSVFNTTLWENVWKKLSTLSTVKNVRDPIVCLPDLQEDVLLPSGCAMVTDSGLVIPEALGDFECGITMLSIKSDVKEGEVLRLMSKIRSSILRGKPIRMEVSVENFEEAISKGPGHFKEYPMTDEEFKYAEQGELGVPRELLNLAKFELLRIDGGNHFLEIDRVEGSEELLFLIHNGSGSIGSFVQTKWIYKGLRMAGGAISMIKAGTTAFSSYFKALQALYNYARMRRYLLANMVINVAERVFHKGIEAKVIGDVSHCSIELLKDEMVYRNGAIRAEGSSIILGVPGGHSYLVRPDEEVCKALNSLNHGVGRVRRGHKFRSVEKVMRILKEERLARPVARLIPIVSLNSNYRIRQFTQVI